MTDAAPSMLSAKPPANSDTPLQTPKRPPPSQGAQPDDWRSAVEKENEARVAAMSPAEREQERQEIIEKFGTGLGDVLKRAREARLRKSQAEKTSSDQDESLCLVYHSIWCI